MFENPAGMLWLHSGRTCELCDLLFEEGVGDEWRESTMPAEFRPSFTVSYSGKNKLPYIVIQGHSAKLLQDPLFDVT